MKGIKKYVFVWCIGLVMLGSCTKSLPPQLKVIPGDALFVVALDNRQLFTKGGLDRMKDFKSYQMFQREINRGDDETKKMMEGLLEKPQSFGIDMKKAYLFGYEGRRDVAVAVVFKMDNVKRFEDRVQELTGSNDQLSVEDKGAYKIVETYGFAVAWNKDLLIAGTESDKFDQLMNQPKGNSIVSNSDFVNFHSGSYDAGLWMSYGKIFDKAMSHSGMQKSPVLSDMKKMNMHVYLNFNQGEVTLSGEMTPKSEVKDFFSKYPVMKSDFDKNILRAFPDQSYLTIKQSIDLQSYLKMLKDMDSTFDQIMKDPDARTLINGLGGDFLLSVYGFEQGDFPVPMAGLGFNVQSKAVFDKLLELASMEMYDMIIPKDNYYEVSNRMMNISLYFAFKDNVIFVTTDKEAIIAFTEKGQKRPMSASASNFYVNLDIDSYPKEARNFLYNEMGVSASDVSKYMKPFKEFRIDVDKDFKTVVTLKLSNRENSLKQILTYFDEIAADRFN